jgi:tRNA(Ile)-lysidine synthase TilS/MesJ
MDFHKLQMDLITDSSLKINKILDEVDENLREFSPKEEDKCFRCDNPEIVYVDDSSNWHCSDCHSKLME